MRSESGIIEDDSLSRLAIGTTVMDNKIAYPADTRLFEKASFKIVALAREAGTELHLTYACKVSLLAAEVGRYAHAGKSKRMRNALRTLTRYTGRVRRDLSRQTIISRQMPSGKQSSTPSCWSRACFTSPQKGDAKIHNLVSMALTASQKARRKCAA